MMRTISLLSVALLLAACAEDGPAMDASSLSDRLAGAVPGETVSIGAVAIEGAFEVPDGVTLRGESEESTLVVPEGEVGIRLAPGASVAALTVESAGLRAIESEGDGTGEVAITDITIRASLGQAIFVSGLAAVTLSGVDVEGPVTEDNATEVPPTPGTDQTLTHGVALVSVERATVASLSISGAGRFAAVFVNSSVELADSTFVGNLGTAVMVHGGTADFSAVSVRRTLQGFQPTPAYGVVVAGGAAVQTTALEILDNDGYGLVQDGGEATHEGLVAGQNGEPGVWAQREATLEIHGEGSELADNRLGGLVVVDPLSVEVRQTLIRGTRTAPRIVGELGEVRVGDGIHALAETAAGLRFSDLKLRANERVGVLLDLESGTVAEGVFEAIVVDAPEDGYGAIAQGADGPLELGAWDADIERLGRAAANDPTVQDRFQVVGLIAPMFLPRGPESP